jgi:hypothetical protein
MVNPLIFLKTDGFPIKQNNFFFPKMPTIMYAINTVIPKKPLIIPY